MNGLIEFKTLIHNKENDKKLSMLRYTVYETQYEQCNLDILGIESRFVFPIQHI